MKEEKKVMGRTCEERGKLRGRDKTMKVFEGKYIEFMLDLGVH